MKPIVTIILSTAVIAIIHLSPTHADEQAVEAYKPEIEAALKAGKITKEQADKKLTWLREHGGPAAEKMDTAIDEIKAALDAGTITEAQAKQKYMVVKKSAAFADAKAKIAAALKNGEISEADAALKYEHLAMKWKKLNAGLKDDPEAL